MAYCNGFQALVKSGLDERSNPPGEKKKFFWGGGGFGGGKKKKKHVTLGQVRYGTPAASRTARSCGHQRLTPVPSGSRLHVYLDGGTMWQALTGYCKVEPLSPPMDRCYDVQLPWLFWIAAALQRAFTRLLKPTATLAIARTTVSAVHKSEIQAAF